jgi:hypothetical protein
MLWRAAIAEEELSPEELAQLERFCQAFDTWRAAEIAKADGRATSDPPPARRPPPAAPMSRVASYAGIARTHTG